MTTQLHVSPDWLTYTDDIDEAFYLKTLAATASGMFDTTDVDVCVHPYRVWPREPSFVMWGDTDLDTDQQEKFAGLYADLVAKGSE